MMGVYLTHIDLLTRISLARFPQAMRWIIFAAHGIAATQCIWKPLRFKKIANGAICIKLIANRGIRLHLTILICEMARLDSVDSATQLDRKHIAKD